MATEGKLRRGWMVSRAKENDFCVIISLLAIGIFYSVNLREGIILGADDSFHLCRLEGLAVDLANGVFPVKVHSPLCFGYGYGVGLFYQNHFLYFPALLCAAGMSLEMAYKIFSGCITVAIYGSAFYSAYRLCRDKYAALTAAVCLLFSGNVLKDFYMDFHMAGNLAMIFIPLAVAGMIEFVTTDKKPMLLGAGFLGLACSSTQSAYLTFWACAAILLAHAGTVWKKPGKIAEGILAVGAVLLLSISFWMPMLEQFRVQEYKVSRPWTRPEENTGNIFGLLGENGMGWLIFLWLLIILVLLADRGSAVAQRHLLYTLLGIIAFIFTVNATKWFWVMTRPVTGMVQFPGRLLPIGSVLAAFLIALIVCRIPDEKRKKGLACLNFLLAVYFGFHTLSGIDIETRDFGDKAVCEEWAGLSAGEEWLPVETTREMLTDAEMAVAENGTVIRGTKEKGRFILQMDMEKEYYDIPFVYYRGYAAVTEEGIRLKVEKNPDTSMVRVYAMQEDGKAGEGQEVTVWYEGTRIQKASYVVNGLAVMGAAGILWYRGRRRRLGNASKAER